MWTTPVRRLREARGRRRMACCWSLASGRTERTASGALARSCPRPGSSAASRTSARRPLCGRPASLTTSSPFGRCSSPIPRCRPCAASHLASVQPWPMCGRWPPSSTNGPCPKSRNVSKPWVSATRSSVRSTVGCKTSHRSLCTYIWTRWGSSWRWTITTGTSSKRRPHAGRLTAATSRAKAGRRSSSAVATTPRSPSSAASTGR
mmetsp:Transcript_21442/g.53674  ORF Transcript_21442/g.53674 Transcript_21442/m.53674 type:complete len:205 (+) Transcript_21442:403-1017(+)